MSLQSEWQYLQRTVPGVGQLMGPIEAALRDKFFPALFGELDLEEVEALQAVWGHSVKRASLGIPDPTNHAQHSHNTSLQCCDMLVTLIMEKEEMEYGAHKECVGLGSWAARQGRLQREMVQVGGDRQEERRRSTSSLVQ
eukprot:13789522-Ditylum_brightwellii.AAC.1